MLKEQQIDDLISAARNIVTAANVSNERMAVLETNSANMQKALTELAHGQTSMLRSMEELARSSVKVEQDMLRLEEKALDKIKDVQSDTKELEHELGLIAGKVHLLELSSIEVSMLPAKIDKLSSEILEIKLINANNVGREEGARGFKKFLIDNWFNLAKAVFMVGTAIAGAMFIYKNSGGV